MADLGMPLTITSPPVSAPPLYVSRTIRLSVAAEWYAYTAPSVAKVVDSASPNRPPSPLATTFGTRPTVTGSAPGRTSTTSPLLRRLTSAPPSGRKATVSYTHLRAHETRH